MLANQIRPTSLSAAIVFRVHPFLAKKHRELPFLAIAQHKRAKNGTKNGQKRVEAEQSSYYREYPVAFGQKRELVGVGQSDTANITLCSNCFQDTSVFGQKAPGAPVFGHCPIFWYHFRLLFVWRVRRTFFPSGWYFFYLVTTGWIFYISLCESSINQSINHGRH